MDQIYSWQWVQAQVGQTLEVWKDSASLPPQSGQRYSPEEQEQREHAYDRELHEIEREIKCVRRNRAESLRAQDKLVASFARFSAAALDLKGDTIKLLTDEFLPVGTRLAQWARQFDSSLGMPEIIQACRNAWTACGLQSLVVVRLGI